MPREIDLRDVNTYSRMTVGPEDLPAGAVANTGSFPDRALAVAAFIRDVHGAEAGQSIELVPDLGVQTTDSGAATVHLAQYLRGIPVFRASQSVRFSPNGFAERSDLQLATGKVVPEVSFGISSDDAVLIAARHVSSPDEPNDTTGTVPLPPIDLGTFSPTIVSSFSDLNTMPVVYEAGPFAEPITGNLVWFPLNDRLQLAWAITIVLPDFSGMFLTIISADDGEILFCKPLGTSVECRGKVFRSDPNQPRELIDFPLPWSTHGLSVPAEVGDRPADWVATNSTEGPCVEAFVNDTLLPVRGSSVGGVLMFDPAEADGLDQQVINAFFGTCLMHDIAYLLGFREVDSNFQKGSAGPNGLPNQRVRVSVLTGPLDSTAQWVPVQKPVIRLGRKRTTNRHSALDLSIVVHEYMHGICNRLIGGVTVNAPLLATQSRGMGEGWGDYMACMVTGKKVIGAWVANDQSKGLRRFAYDDNFPVDQVNFGLIEDMEIYHIGEMWCATLLEMTKNVGAELGLRLVINGMKGLRADPSVIQGRNGILQEVDSLRAAGQFTASEHSATKAAVWEAFAKFGMGVGAISPDAELFDTVADTTVQ